MALVGLTVLSDLSGSSLLMAGLGVEIMFSGIQDRTLIQRVVSMRLKEAFQQELKETKFMNRLI